MAARARRRQADPAEPVEPAVCQVPGCVPGVHGLVVDGLCPVHGQTHPGLALSNQVRRGTVRV